MHAGFEERDGIGVASGSGPHRGRDEGRREAHVRTAPVVEKMFGRGRCEGRLRKRGELVGGQVIVRTAQMCMQNKLFYRC